MDSTELRPALVLCALLLATLGGCAMYDPRPPVAGNAQVNFDVQDRQIAQDRLARIAKAKELKEADRRASAARLQTYFD